VGSPSGNLLGRLGTPTEGIGAGDVALGLTDPDAEKDSEGTLVDASGRPSRTPGQYRPPPLPRPCRAAVLASLWISNKEAGVRRSIGIAVALAACAMLVVGGSALARGKAETKVKIKTESGGFYGYVKSDKEKCANGRKVTLYKQKGNNPNPKKDEKIGSDIAQANGTKYMWSTGNTGFSKGYFYAYAKRIKGCKAGTSKSVKAEK
jgi:hypothetical protein